MTKGLVVFCCMAMAVAVAKPANNEQLDKATANDVAANAVVATTDKKADSAESAEKKEPATVQITGITTGAEAPTAEDQVLDTTVPPFKPQRATSMFARLIDDIFQIPINVLQNVARLITNPFNQNKSPESSTLG